MEDLPPGSRLALVRSQLRIESESESEHSNSVQSPSRADTEPFPDYDEAECQKLASYIAADKPNEDAWIYACGKAAQCQTRLHEVDSNIIPYIHADPSHRSQVVLEQFQNLLAEPQLRSATRRQFIKLLNHTLQLNQIIFHQSVEFLAPKETSDAKVVTEKILSRLAWMDDLLKEQLESTHNVADILERISMRQISVYEQLRAMANVVSG
jgi:hypothetical protein